MARCWRVRRGQHVRVEVDVTVGVQGAAERLCPVRLVVPGGEVAGGSQRRSELIECGGRVLAGAGSRRPRGCRGS